MVDIAIENVSKVFADRAKPGGVFAAVDGVTLSIPSGALFFLLGPSGCGKTTLLRMIAGFIMPTGGVIRFGGQDITRVPPYQRDTGMVFQSYALWPHMTVGDNVGFGLDVRKFSRADRRTRIIESLALVQMEHLVDRKPNELSGGQQQRVALARALAIRPKCLLLDEPLSNLDAKLRLEMRSEIRKIVKATNITAVYVTHDQKEALSMADGIAVLRAGKLEQTGKPLELYRQPATRFVADFIGESNFLAGTVEGIDGGAVKIRTRTGSLHATGAAGPGVLTGAKVLAAFRPESVTVSAAAGGSETNTLAGTRISTTYLGEMAEHIVELADGARVKAFELNPNMKGVAGEACVVSVAPENLMVVKADEESGGA